MKVLPFERGLFVSAQGLTASPRPASKPWATEWLLKRCFSKCNAQTGHLGAYENTAWTWRAWRGRGVYTYNSFRGRYSHSPGVGPRLPWRISWHCLLSPQGPTGPQGLGPSQRPLGPRLSCQQPDPDPRQRGPHRPKSSSSLRDREQWTRHPLANTFLAPPRGVTQGEGPHSRSANVDRKAREGSRGVPKVQSAGQWRPAPSPSGLTHSTT